MFVCGSWRFSTVTWTALPGLQDAAPTAANHGRHCGNLHPTLQQPATLVARPAVAPPASHAHASIPPSAMRPLRCWLFCALADLDIINLFLHILRLLSESNRN